MDATSVVSALLKAELYREIKAFLDRRDKRCGPGDPRGCVSLETLMALKIKHPALPLEHLEMIAAVFRNSTQGVIRWMKSQRPDLHNKKPADLLSSADGVADVKREIEKLFRAL